MKDIIKWCNYNQGFLMIILTIIYVGATILIWIANKKSTNASEMALIQSSEIQKQSSNIELFNGRFKLYNNIIEVLEGRYNSIGRPSDKVWGNISTKTYNKSLDTEMLKVKYIYGDSCYKYLKEVIEIINGISSKCFAEKYIYELIQRDNELFATKIKIFIEDSDLEHITDADESKFQNLCENNTIYVSTGHPDDYKLYNYYEILKEIQKLEKEFCQKKKVLLKELEGKMIIGF